MDQQELARGPVLQERGLPVQDRTDRPTGQLERQEQQVLELGRALHRRDQLQALVREQLGRREQHQRDQLQQELA